MKRERRLIWTPSEDKMLIDGFDELSLAELCGRLGRSPAAVGARCGALGLEARRANPANELAQAWFGVVQ